MSDIIEEIYNGMLARNHDYSLEDQDMLRRDAELWDRASPALGHEMVDALQDSQDNQSSQPSLLHTLVGTEVGSEAQLGDGGALVPKHLVLLPAVVDAIGEHSEHPDNQQQHQGCRHQAQEEDEQQT